MNNSPYHINPPEQKERVLRNNSVGKDLQKKRLKKELTRSILHKFYIQSALYAVFIIALFGVGYYVCAQKIWYESTPFYSLVHWLHYNWFSCFLSFFTVGLLLLTFRYFRKFIYILEYILNEVELMAEEPAEPSIDHNMYLGFAKNSSNPPRELREIQLQIDQIREQMELNRWAAKEAEQRKNDLIVYMAHDLKTPLTSVIGYLNLLHDEKEISSQLREKYMSIALHKAERLEELINEFFEITRLQLSNLVLQKENVNLGLMLEQITYEFRPQLQEKNINYELHLEPGLELNCDIDKIERVFDNLLKNAFHYSYENSTIHISAYKEMGHSQTSFQDMTSYKSKAIPQYETKNQNQNQQLPPSNYPNKIPQIIIQVDNQGPTIPPEKLDRIFEQFFRMDHSRASYSGGAGLGLAIAKDIVEAHNGRITCFSEQEHICFRILLPS